jgi:hypothetical protein
MVVGRGIYDTDVLECLLHCFLADVAESVSESLGIQKWWAARKQDIEFLGLYFPFTVGPMIHTIGLAQHTI